MRVLVTGASGRFAPYVVRELTSTYEVVLTSRRKPAEELSALPWIKADLTSFEDCRRAVKGVEAIQHIGAQPGPTDHPKSRAAYEKRGIGFDDTFKTNMLGTYYLLQAAVAEGVKVMVMAGSNCALGHGFRISGTPFPIHRLPIDETHPTYPEDSYSFTKRAAEDLLDSYTRAYGIRTYITRLGGITSEEGRREIAESAGPASGWDEWLFDWVSSEDAANAHRLLMEAAEELPPHDFYMLSADDTTALESSRELIERFRPELIPVAEGLEGHQGFISSDKLKRAVGWEHRITWRDFLQCSTL
ncbi:MAG TPA: NAD(P)-dependent oxidoreductase [Anaerolineae bacterium]|nr:NAD(P)-dependent oxidoreductase [Anaerolineae bacterium]